MKYIRLFGSANERDAALQNVDYNVLQKTDGVGIGIVRSAIGPTPPTPSYSTPFYVENITNEVETLTILSHDLTGEETSYLEIPVEYSTDGTNWSSLGTTGATPLTRTLQPGDKVYLRATTNTWYEYQDEPYIEHGCTIYGVSKVGGNIMSLLYGSNFTGNETAFPSGSNNNFTWLFTAGHENTELISASELILPATTLAANCYQGMFGGCTALTSVPTLPATTLADACYDNMFAGCTSLTWDDVPALPATTLAEGCYVCMFADPNKAMLDEDYSIWCTNHIPASANYDSITHGRLFDPIFLPPPIDPVVK